MLFGRGALPAQGGALPRAGLCIAWNRAVAGVYSK